MYTQEDIVAWLDNAKLENPTEMHVGDDNLYVLEEYEINSAVKAMKEFIETVGGLKAALADRVKEINSLKDRIERERKRYKDIRSIDETNHAMAMAHLLDDAKRENTHKAKLIQRLHKSVKEPQVSSESESAVVQDLRERLQRQYKLICELRHLVKMGNSRNVEDI